MIKMRCLGSSSNGNCYLINFNNQIFILDCGIEMGKVKKALNYNILNIVGAFSSHVHADHSKSASNFRQMGIEVFAPYEQVVKKLQTRHFGNFKVTALPMLDKNMEVWQHTNTDMSQCPIYGALIEVNNQKILYVTDCKQCVWNFKKQKINHILLGIDFQNELLSDDGVKRHHVLTGHMSLTTGREMIKANATDSLRTVILCHMSDNSTDKDICIGEVQKVADCPVYVAKKGLEIELRESRCPF